MGPDDIDTARNNPDLIAAPSTDHSSVYVITCNHILVLFQLSNKPPHSKNAKWPLKIEPQQTLNWWLGSSAEWLVISKVFVISDKRLISPILVNVMPVATGQ